jgi:ABC-type transport system involved in multi-copper enzyme maturation permease subunit
MRELIALELSAVPRRSIVIAWAVVGVIAVTFVYFFAVVGRYEEDPSGILSDRRGVIGLAVTVTVCCAAITGTVLFARHVIRDYRKERLAVLLSYPRGRRPLLMAKLAANVIPMTVVTASSLLVAVTLFWITEAVAPILDQHATAAGLADALLRAALAVLVTIALTLIAGLIGLWRGSGVTAMVTAVILVAIVGNGAASLFTLNLPLAALITAGACVLAATTALIATQRVATIEPF